ncbi:hypothetical protein J7E99_03200 [Streptomyces sp. ISL-44]|uniref:effector-associated constant component EACC1 n=1 Tax=Streptomyces sp. ISL-44 TaxID=2819184 RepID=UPI001BEBCF5C|nr:hypothetical protein [Streptomyces sp. ISL-44]MBT2539739.1 hypothetical protein [Streptomyces sp. ISL-44]
MIVLVSTTDGEAADELRSLRAELLDDADWRGRVELMERPPESGTLGPVVEALQLVLDPASLAALLGSVAAWLRYRTSDVKLTVRRTDKGTDITLDGVRVQQLDAPGLVAELEKLTDRLNAEEQRDSGS